LNIPCNCQRGLENINRFILYLTRVTNYGTIHTFWEKSQKKKNDQSNVGCYNLSHTLIDLCYKFLFSLVIYFLRFTCVLYIPLEF